MCLSGGPVLLDINLFRIGYVALLGESYFLLDVYYRGVGPITLSYGIFRLKYLLYVTRVVPARTGKQFRYSSTSDLVRRGVVTPLLGYYEPSPIRRWGSNIFRTPHSGNVMDVSPYPPSQCYGRRFNGTRGLRNIDSSGCADLHTGI